MRQLVSVVTDQTVSYFLQDEDPEAPVLQVAQVLNMGLDVPEVLDLGANLVQSLKLNGRGARARAQIAAPAPRAMKPATQPELEPVKPEPPARNRGGRPKGPAKRPMRRWGFTREAVLADLRAHPGTTYVEAALRISGSSEKAAVGAYSASLQLVERHLLGTGARVTRTQTTGPGSDGRMTRFSLLTLEEPTPQEPQEEQ